MNNKHSHGVLTIWGAIKKDGGTASRNLRERNYWLPYEFDETYHEIRGSKCKYNLQKKKKKINTNKQKMCSKAGHCSLFFEEKYDRNYN